MVDFKTAVPIGEGATGEVMKAWSDDLDCHVAIKYLKRNDPDWISRLRREAAAIARIHHPAVPKIHAIDIDPSGRSYLVMDYINGRPLNEIAEDLSLEQRVWLMQEIADAIQAAHSEGLIHRDIKPANILIEQTPAGALKPWVVDFGLVHDDQATKLTMTGAIMGTPNFMSPEQAAGNAQIDRRSDVYSLGATLYYLLTLQKPFPGDSTSEILGKVLRGDLKPPHLTSRKVPRALSAICLHAMEYDVKHRFASARMFAQALEHYLKGETHEAATLDISYHWRRIWRLRKPWIVGGGVAALLALVAVSALWWQQLRAEQAADQIQRFATLVEQRNQTFRLAQLTPNVDIAPIRITLRQAYEQEEASLSAFPESARPAAEAALGRGYRSLGLNDKALQLLESAYAQGFQQGPALFALAMARTHAYQQELQKITLTQDPALREEQTLQAIRQWRDPAIAALKAAQQAGISEVEFGNALIALLEERFDDVAQPANQALAQTPWWFESHIVMGDSFAEQARQAVMSGKADAAEAHYQQAIAAYSDAIEIAPSSFQGLAKRCSMSAGMVHVVATISRRDPASLANQAMQYCTQARQSDGSAYRPLAYQSQILQDSGIYRYIHGEDPDREFARAQELAELAMRKQANDPEVMFRTAVLLRRRAFIAVGNGSNPTALVERGIEILEELVGIDASPFFYYTTWGNLLLDLAEFNRDQQADVRPLMQRAADKFKQALQRRPQQNTVLMNLAVTESMLAEEHVKHQDDAAAEAAFNSALNRYDAALELDPNDFDSLKNRTILATQYARFLGPENPKSGPLLDQSYNALQAHFNQHKTDRTAQLALADAVLASRALSSAQSDWFTRLKIVLPLLKETLQDGQGRHQAALQNIYYQLVFAGIWAASDQQRAVELARTALSDSAETASQNPHYWPVVLSAAALGLVTTDQWQAQWETSHNAKLEQPVEDWVQTWLTLHQQASPSECPDPIPLLVCGRNRIVDDRTVHQLRNPDQTLKDTWWWQEFASLVDDH